MFFLGDYLRESRIMLLHYFSGIGILVSGAVHLSLVFFFGSYEENLSFDSGIFSVIAVYRNFAFALTLELLLVFVAFHAFNGLRVILIELHKGKKWEMSVNWVLTVIATFLVIYGTRTVLLARLLT
jgi:succinate dehydrogenase / fumarate reductase membrane anchor subunit